MHSWAARRPGFGQSSSTNGADVLSLARGKQTAWKPPGRHGASDDFLRRFGELVVVGIDHATGEIDVRLLWSTDVEPTSVLDGENVGYSVKDLGVCEGKPGGRHG